MGGPSEEDADGAASAAEEAGEGADKVLLPAGQGERQLWANKPLSLFPVLENYLECPESWLGVLGPGGVRILKLLRAAAK